MRLEISIDSMPYMIDTTDPVLLGKWAEEILARAVAGEAGDVAAADALGGAGGEMEAVVGEVLEGAGAKGFELADASL